MRQLVTGWSGEEGHAGGAVVDGWCCLVGVRAYVSRYTITDEIDVFEVRPFASQSALRPL